MKFKQQRKNNRQIFILYAFSFTLPHTVTVKNGIIFVHKFNMWCCSRQPLVNILCHLMKLPTILWIGMFRLQSPFLFIRHAYFVFVSFFRFVLFYFTLFVFYICVLFFGSLLFKFSKFQFMSVWDFCLHLFLFLVFSPFAMLCFVVCSVFLLRSLHRKSSVLLLFAWQTNVLNWNWLHSN